MNIIKLLLLPLFLICSCQKSSPVSSKPLILVSIAPYRFLTEEIVGEDFVVQTIVPAATNPHAFEPKSSQVMEMAKGVAWFRIGEPFETKILPVLARNNPNLRAQDLREGIAMIEESHGHSCKGCSIDHLDRHIWLSPKLAAEQATLIAKVMGDQFPDKKELFQTNLAALKTKLEILDQEIQALLKPIVRRTILVSHPAFGYFCKEYNLEQLSVEFEGKDPRPKHLEEILLKATQDNMEAALALPQYNNKGAQIIAAKLHVPIHLINPYSSDYFETMRRLAQLIAAPHDN